MPRWSVAVLALLLTACGQEASSGPTPDPSTTTFFCGSYDSEPPGTVTSFPPGPC